MFRALAIYWRLWATYIAKMPVHERDQAIQLPPPDRYIQGFTHCPEDREQRYVAVSSWFWNSS